MRSGLIRVLPAERYDTLPVRAGEVDAIDLARGDQPEKPHLSIRSESINDRPRRLSDDRDGRSQLSFVLGDDSHAVGMSIRLLVGSRQPYVRVDEEHGRLHDFGRALRQLVPQLVDVGRRPRRIARVTTSEEPPEGIAGIRLARWELGRQLGNELIERETASFCLGSSRAFASGGRSSVTGMVISMCIALAAADGPRDLGRAATGVATGEDADLPDPWLLLPDRRHAANRRRDEVGMEGMNVESTATGFRAKLLDTQA